MKNLKSNFKKIISFTIVGIMALAIVPVLGIVKSISKNKADATDVTVSNSSFAEITSDNNYNPKDWTSEYELTDDDVFFIGGRISVTNFTEDRDALISAWVNNWKRNNQDIADLDECAQNLTALIQAKLAQNPGIYVYEITNDTYVLGTTSAYKVVVTDKDNITLTPIANNYTFSSPATSVDAYGYYKVSVNVKTVGDVDAKISATKLSNSEEITINSSASIINSYAYDYYTSATAEAIPFVTNTAFTIVDGETITYDNKTYTYDEANVKWKNEDSYFTNPTVINSNNWERKTVYFTTKTSDSIKITLSTINSDGNEGTVYFDNLKVEKIDYSEYYHNTNNDNTISDNRYSESMFVNNAAYFTLTSEENGTSFETVEGGLLINHYNSGSVSYKLSIDPSVDSFIYNRFAIWIKTESTSSTFSINVTGDVKNNPSAKVNSSITANEWVEYSIFVKGNSYEEIGVTIELTFSKEGKHTIGYIVMEQITSDEYTNASGTKLSLNTNDISGSITNGYFNSYVSKNVDSINYFPTSWSYVNNDKVYTFDSERDALYNEEEDIEIDSADFSADIENAADDMSNFETGLLVRNDLLIISDFDEISYMRSPEINFAADTDTYIIFSANIENNKVVTIKLIDSNSNVLTTIDITGTGNVETYRLYVRAASKDITATINFGVTNESGIVRLANVNKYTAHTMDSIIASKVSDLQNAYLLDLSNNKFKSFTYESYENGIYKSAALELKSTENAGIYGILDTKENSTYKTTYKENLTSTDPETDAKVIILDNTSANNRTTIGLDNKFTLDSSNYYKVTVKVKTLSLDENSTFNILFRASNTDKSLVKEFNNVVTDDSGYQSYILYIATGNETFDNFDIQFDLNGKGTVLVDSINVESSSKSVFSEIEEDAHTLTSDFIVASSSSESSDKKEETEEKPQTNTLMIFFLVFSSIILVAAVLIALIFIGAKRLPHHKKAAKTKKQNPRQGKGFV